MTTAAVRQWIRAWLALAMMLAGASASLSVAAWADTSAPVVFAIPAGSLTSSLNAVAIQSNLQIFYQDDAVHGLTASAVNGTMAPRDALQIILADTNLEFVQNRDDTILVRPKGPAVTRSPVPSPRPARRHAAASDTPTPTAPAPFPIQATSRPWMLRGRAVYLDAANGSHSHERWRPELDLVYLWSHAWAVELAATAPQSRYIAGGGPTAAGCAPDRGFREQQNDLTLKRVFMSGESFRPYVGAGVAYTHFSHAVSSCSINSPAVAAVAQLGFDQGIGAAWSFNVDVKWSHGGVDMEAAGVRTGRLSLDPFRFAFGIAYHFGGTPTRATSVLSEPVINTDGNDKSVAR